MALPPYSLSRFRRGPRTGGGPAGILEDVADERIRAHSDGKVIVPDAPPDLRPDQALIVHIDTIEGEPGESALAWIAANAADSDALPADLADPATLAAVVLLMMAVALMACLVPAHRAMTVDPMVALRDE